jgi:thiamine biosynthesis protein ThiI
VGGELAEAFPHVAVDVHKPDLTVYVEIREKHAYVHAPSVPGAGGLPIGMGGKAVSLLSGGIDSPVSSYLIAKRGVRLVPVHFFSFPYTSELAKQKVIDLAKLLEPYTGRMTLQIVPFTHIQEEIRRQVPEEYFTLVMRRFMMRIAADVAAHSDCKAIVTGENLGQVASQTMEAMASTQSVIDLPVLQPLIGMDKTDIIRYAREIGTFETSILPYEDCCTVFTPRHPKTRPTVAEVAQVESVMDIEGLVREAVEGIERIKIGYEC